MMADLRFLEGHTRQDGNQVTCTSQASMSALPWTTQDDEGASKHKIQAPRSAIKSTT